MKVHIAALIFLLVYTSTCYTVAQDTELEIEGGVKIGDVTTTPEPGTIRWTGSDFEGWNGQKWISLTVGTLYEDAVTDYDNNSYKTVKIGSQVWMAENLRVAHYNDGTPITNITDSTSWADATTGAWCWYNNDSSLETPYGKLYNWYAVNNDTSLGLCPSGWHVASRAEIDSLFETINSAYFPDMDNTAGGEMKEQGYGHWAPPNFMATNASGFTGLPGGRRSSDLGNFDFDLLFTWGYWWTITEVNSDYAYIFGLENVSPVLLHGGGLIKRHGFTVRCIKD